jgi:hypothetical protein
MCVEAYGTLEYIDYLKKTPQYWFAFAKKIPVHIPPLIQYLLYYIETNINLNTKTQHLPYGNTYNDIK